MGTSHKYLPKINLSYAYLKLIKTDNYSYIQTTYFHNLKVAFIPVLAKRKLKFSFDQRGLLLKLNTETINMYYLCLISFKHQSIRYYYYIYSRLYRIKSIIYYIFAVKQISSL